jgi:FkbM family methyltransferase
MRPALQNKNIDLVDFEDLKLFMLKNDNLYNIAVSEDRKNQSLSKYQAEIREKGYPRSLVTPESINDVTSARFGFYLFLHHLWEHDSNRSRSLEHNGNRSRSWEQNSPRSTSTGPRNADLTILDIGSHIGDFSLKMGNFIRTCGKACRVISFDPTEAGVLVNYNIELNGLNEIVRHEDLAVSDFDGLMLFDYSPGFSDSTHVSERIGAAAASRGGKFHSFRQKSLKEKLLSLITLPFRRVRRAIDQQTPEAPTYNFIARAVDIAGYLERNGLNGDLFVKIDVEGMDTKVIDRLLTLLPSRLISIAFEFTPRSFGDGDTAARYLRDLSDSFHMFDLFYSPNPTRFRLIGPGDCQAFVPEVRQRKYGYTDIFLLDKRTPDCEQLVERLSGLKESEDEMRL